MDQPPLIALVAWLVRAVLGQSLAAIRLLPALAGVAEVLLTALIARELGGKRFAQALAALSVLVAPAILGIDALLTMNAFEPLFWMGCAYLAIRIIKTGNTKLWMWFGLLAGFGLENKYSMLIFGAGLVLGLLLSAERRVLQNRWLWLGGAIALLIFVPNLIWNIQHHFPFLEVQANIRANGRDVPLGPIAFFAQEILLMLPLSAPIWLGGLWFYFFTAAGKPFRAIGWAWIFSAAVIVILSPRVYYLFPAFPSAVRGRRRAVGALAGAAETGVDQVCVSGADADRWGIACAAGHSGIAARDLHSVHESDRAGTAAHRESQAGAVAADFRGSVRMARDGGGGGARLQRLAAGGSIANGSLRADLRAGWSDRSVRPEVRIAAGGQRSSELLSLGAARVHGREHDRDG